MSQVCLLVNDSSARKQRRHVERDAAPGFERGDFGEVFLFELGELGLIELCDQTAKAGVPDHAPSRHGIVERVADVVFVYLHVA